MKNPISKKQIQLIHILLHKCGISDDDYREKLDRDFKVTTCKDLSYKQAKTLIKDLEGYAKAYGINIRSEVEFNYTRRPGMATPAQLRMIEAMWKDVSRAKTVKKRRKTLRAFLSNKFGVSDMKFIPHNMPHKIIHTLEAMKKQKQERQSVNAN